VSGKLATFSEHDFFELSRQKERSNLGCMAAPLVKCQYEASSLKTATSTREMSDCAREKRRFARQGFQELLQ